MKQRFVDLYMDWAQRLAQMSYAKRLQVGAIIVRDDSVISYGYNGTPSGWDNICEDKEWCSAGGWLSPEEIEEGWPYEGTYTDTNGNVVTGRYRLKTKPEVLHAEMNALMKLAKSNRSGDNAAIFITHAPCMECAKGIYSAGITEVFYRDEYRSPDGVYFLRRCGINVSKYDKKE